MNRLFKFSFLLALSLVLCATPAASEQADSPLQIKLSPSEAALLSQLEAIRLCVDPDWMPYEKVTEDGAYIGLVADHMEIISRWVGKEFRLIQTASWSESLKTARMRGCDILPGAVPTPQRREYLSFSDPYIFLPLVIATGTEEMFIVDMTHVAHKTFTIIEGYAAIELLREKYPGIQIREVPDVATGLNLVLSRQAFGYIDSLPTISYHLQKNKLTGIKISGELEFKYDISIAVRNDQPLLLSIINKAIASVSHEERQKLFYDWISVKHEKPFDYGLLWKIVAAIAAALALLIYRNVVVSRYNRKLAEANEKLDVLYKTDKLTALSNRNVLDVEVEKELYRTTRYNTTTSAILLDLDHFKRVNDSYGHYVGDSVLKETASIIRNNTRNLDVAGRWGGEEFLLICPETDIDSAAIIAEKLRQQIADNQFVGVEHGISASFGVAQLASKDSVESIIKRLDQALYTSKNNGRNCVTLMRNQGGGVVDLKITDS